MSVMVELLTKANYVQLVDKYQKGLEFFGRDYLESRLKQLENKKDKAKLIVVDLKRKSLVEQKLLIKVLREVISKNS
jgi:uncharacterized protein (DUF1330 family)